MKTRKWRDEIEIQAERREQTDGYYEDVKELEKAGYEAVYGYIRVSTEGQAGEDKFGIDMQKKAIRDYCITKRMYVKEWYVDVVSGVEEKREALNYLMYSYEPQKVKRIVAFKSDRIARDTKLYFYILYMLEKKGLKLECVTEEFETEGEFANLYRSMLMFCAEQERKNIKMRTERGRAEKRKEGGYYGGNLAYGYGTAGGELRVNRREAYIVQFIFYSYYEKGMSYRKIGELLNNKRVPTKRGGVWHTSTIKRIIENKRFYQGYMTDVDGKEIKGKHTALLRNASPEDNTNLVLGLSKRSDFNEFDENKKTIRNPDSVQAVKQMREFGETQRQQAEAIKRWKEGKENE